jgi:small neutral amino acid transporter SnatA (MarC family)
MNAVANFFFFLGLIVLSSAYLGIGLWGMIFLGGILLVITIFSLLSKTRGEEPRMVGWKVASDEDEDDDDDTSSMVPVMAGAVAASAAASSCAVGGGSC